MRQITIVNIFCCILSLSSCNRGMYHARNIIGVSTYIPEGIFSFTEGSVIYNRTTTLYFDPDTSLIVKNMGVICKEIDSIAKSSPVDIIVEIWDYCEQEPDDYLSIIVYPPKFNVSECVLGISSSLDYLKNDTLVPIVKKSLDFIVEGNIPNKEPIKIVSTKDEIDLLTNLEFPIESEPLFSN